MNGGLLPVEEAQARMLALLAPLAPELLPVERASGRYLAAPVRAARTQPPADLSAMDGYAVAGAGPWRRVGESRCGEPFGGAVNAGECVRISTGAILPPGADRILIQEDATVAGDIITATCDPEPAKHIRRTGFEFAAGDLLLPAGTKLGPAQIALLRSGGHGAVPVHTAPVVALFDSGDELTHDPAGCAIHQIPASNSAMLAALAGSLPCTVHTAAPLPDRLEAIVAALEAEHGADLVVLTGGASVGDHDLARPALEAVGATLAFWKVALRPGKPLLVARRGTQLILGLPGNPVSSFVTGILFMLPAIRTLLGAADPLPRRLYLPTAADLPPGGERREYLRGQIGPDGVAPFGSQDSSALRTLANADCLIERAEGCPGLARGALVPVCLIGNGGIA